MTDAGESTGTADPPAAARFPLGYRPSLDGFRAVAVLLVIGFHLGFLPAAARQGGPLWSVLTHLREGELGVEMFFVLSGFLITRLLLHEWETTGGVNLRDFYVRRARRLLPALAVVLLGCGLYAVVRMASGDAVDQLHSTIATVCYVQNWALIGGWVHTTGIMTHTWSLSIEEQFYVLWPLLVLVLLRSHVTRRAVLVIVAGGAATLAVWRAILTIAGASDVRLYFGFDTRADSLLIGCAAAIFVASPTLSRWAARTGRFAAVAGVAAVVIAGCVVRPTYDRSFDYYGGLTLVALASAVVIVFLFVRDESVGARLLAARPAVWIGRRSYGIYLWHFPVLAALIRYDASWPALYQAVLAVFAAFLLAGASYAFIERRFLRKRRIEDLSSTA